VKSELQLVHNFLLDELSLSLVEKPIFYSPIRTQINDEREREREREERERERLKDLYE